MLTLQGRRHFVALLLPIILLSGQALAGDKYAGAWMVDGGGARALGMGSAFVAVADDASTSFWNPAGLLDLDSREIVAMHSERFGDLVDRDFAAYAQPVRGGAFAVSVLRFATDDIAITEGILPDGSDPILILDPQYADQIRYDSNQDWAFFGSYARRFGDWQWGGSVKFIRQSLVGYTNFGLGVDVGVLRRSIWRRLDVGAKLQDATTTYLSWSTGTSETIDPVFIPGAAYRWDFPELHLGLRASSALETHFDNRGEADQFSMGGSLTGNLYLGLEATLRERAQLRLGSHGGTGSEDLTAGAGLILGSLRVDYAFAGDVLDSDQNTHRVSLGYKF